MPTTINSARIHDSYSQRLFVESCVKDISVANLDGGNYPLSGEFFIEITVNGTTVTTQYTNNITLDGSGNGAFTDDIICFEFIHQPLPQSYHIIQSVVHP